MRRYSIVVLLFLVMGLVVANVMLLYKACGLEEEVENELRGIYIYPGIGALFVSKNSDSIVVQPSLTLAIFFSAETSCPSCLSEVASYGRLLSVFRERGQKIVAVTMRKDSVKIAAFLEAERLDIPLMVSRLGMTFEEMGMYPKFMPFKILFDSTNTAIYMRGANNSPEGQADFEAATLWLSNAIHKK